jgi:hypothetical protein
LCERWQKLALVVLAEPLLELGAGELARRLDHRSLAVDPFGLDRVEPRASARQPADQKAATMAGPLDLAIVPPDPVPHLAADVPGGPTPSGGPLGDPGVVPDQRKTRTSSAASCSATQARKAQVTGLIGRPLTKRSSIRSRAGSHRP